MRITAQLIDAASGNHLWADRFDGSLDDIFDLQDLISNCGYMPYLHFSAALGSAGRTEEAQATEDKVVELQPEITISEVRKRFAGMHEKILG